MSGQSLGCYRCKTATWCFQVVDRSTIARHLLSDQIDPFTRQPLTMDMVVPQPELQQEIQAWIEAKKSGN